jgi:hypothetical protein
MLRFFITFVLACLIAACSDRSSSILTYQELVTFGERASCSRKEADLQVLHNLQAYFKFPDDPDAMNEGERIYNGRLKSIIWWYTYSCEQL